jgi:2-Cys peroxiredoxin 5
MASNTALRRLALNASQTSRSFHSSSRAFIKVGDKIPNLDVLVESSPGNKVNLSEAIKGKALIIGVPAAFSKSGTHLTLIINQ